MTASQAASLSTGRAAPTVCSWSVRIVGQVGYPAPVRSAADGRRLTLGAADVLGQSSGCQRSRCLRTCIDCKPLDQPGQAEHK